MIILSISIKPNNFLFLLQLFFILIFCAHELQGRPYVVSPREYDPSEVALCSRKRLDAASSGPVQP